MEVFKCKEFTFASEWLRRKSLSTSVLSLLPLLSKTIHHHPKPIFKSLGSNGEGISMGGGGERDNYDKTLNWLAHKLHLAFELVNF